MSGRFRTRGLILAITLTLLPVFACSRPTPNLPSESATQTNASSFHPPETTAAEPSSQEFAPTDGLGKNPPFQKSQIVPAGSLVTVRLKAPLIAGTESRDPFAALLDEPVIVEGNTLIPRDATVSGEIEAAHLSKIRSDRGYVRLTLNSMQVNGISVPIQTASLFAQPTVAHSASETIRLEKGRRLTFRLRQEVFLHPGAPRSGQ